MAMIHVTRCVFDSRTHLVTAVGRTVSIIWSLNASGVQQPDQASFLDQDSSQQRTDQVIPILHDQAAFVSGSGNVAMAVLIQSQPQRRRTRTGSASSSSRKAWTSAALASRVA